MAIEDDIWRYMNPVCTIDRKLPPAPDNCALDPAEPHPDEPGAPADAPPIRSLSSAIKTGGDAAARS